MVLLYPLILAAEVSPLIMFPIVLGITLIVCIPIYINRKSTEKDQDAIIKQALEELEEFNETASVKGRHDEFFYLAVDDNRNKVFYYKDGAKWVFNYSNIISATLRLGNEEEISRRSTLGTVGGALIGGALAGGVGAIIGGGSASSSSKKVMDSISIHVLLRDMIDTKDSVLDIFIHKGQLEQGEGMYNIYHPIALKAMDLFTLAIDKAENMAKQQPRPERAAPTKQKSLVEELNELAKLKEQGFLSEEEFNKAKAKLLA